MIEMVTVTDGDAARVATAGGTLTFIAAASPINHDAGDAINENRSGMLRLCMVAIVLSSVTFEVCHKLWWVLIISS